MYTSCATGWAASAAHTASAMHRLSISMALLRVGASAETKTTVSSARSKRCSVAAASGLSRSSSLRVSATTGALSAARRAQIAPPTKPPAPITTTRLGVRRMEVECSSIVGLRELAALGIFNIEFLRHVELRGACRFDSRLREIPAIDFDLLASASLGILPAQGVTIIRYEKHHPSPSILICGPGV